MTWQLRPYQADSVAAIEAKLPETDLGVLYVLATGGGKTPIFVEIVRRAAARRESSCILVHRRELLDQTSATLRLAGVAHGLISPEHQPGSALVHVASIDTLRARSGRMAAFLGSLDNLVCDEAHHIVADKYATIRAAAKRARFLGVTATPYRLDGKGLGDAFDQSVLGPSIPKLTELGWLVPGRIYQPPMPGMGFDGVRRRMGDLVTSDLDLVVNHRKHILRAIEHWKKWCQGRPTILFANSVDHAHNCAKLFRTIGGAKASSIDADTAKPLRDAAVKGLADGSTEVLINVEILGEGYDCPAAAAGIFFRKTESVALMQQQFGRLLRPDDIHDDAVVLDLVGNVRQNGMPDEIRPWSLLQGLKNLEKSVPKPLRCERCWRVQPIVPACIECGRAFVAMPPAPAQSTVGFASLSPAIRSMSTQLIRTMKLTGSGSLVELASSRADFQHIAQVRGYKPGWVDRQVEFKDEARRRIAYQRRRA